MSESREFKEYVQQVTAEFHAIPNKEKRKPKKVRHEWAKKKKRKYNYVCQSCGSKFTTKLIFAKECRACYFMGKFPQDELSKEFREICS